ncbi:MAG: hypothetical protein ACXVPU_08140 [Bacteroidia bacterium]
MYKDILHKLLNEDISAGNNAVITGAVFLVASYISGHFIYSIGGLLDSFVYDFFRKLFYSKQDKAIEQVRTIKKKIVDEKMDESSNSSINEYKWAKSVIEIKQPDLIGAVNKFEADQKFFRSFTILALFNSIVVIIAVIFQGFQNCMGARIIFWVVIFLLSLHRFINRRFKGHRQAFETIIVLKSLDML